MMNDKEKRLSQEEQKTVDDWVNKGVIWLKDSTPSNREAYFKELQHSLSTQLAQIVRINLIRITQTDGKIKSQKLPDFSKTRS